MTRIAANSKILKYEITMLRGDDIIFEGTLGDCAEQQNVQPETIRFYLTEAYARRLGRRKNLDRSIVVVRTDDEDDVL